MFQRNSSITPSHIVDDSDQQESNYVREVLITEIFPNKDIVNGQPSRLRTFDLAFYPLKEDPIIMMFWELQVFLVGLTKMDY